MENQTSSESATGTDRQLSADEKKKMPEELSSESVENSEPGHEEYKYVTGFKLAIVIVSVTLVFFLVMLDLSIIATVSQLLGCKLTQHPVLLITGPGYPSHYKSIPLFA